jgi:hypothetical protein
VGPHVLRSLETLRSGGQEIYENVILKSVFPSFPDSSTIDLHVDEIQNDNLDRTPSFGSRSFEKRFMGENR